MPQVALVRAFRIRAHHRYWRKDWSAERNAEAFGELAESHPHDYRIEVEVTGVPDPETGFLVNLAEFDSLLAEALEPFRGGDLNRSIPEVREGKILPSTEALAQWVWERVDGRLPSEISLCRTAVWESEELGAEVVGRADLPERGE